MRLKPRVLRFKINLKKNAKNKNLSIYAEILKKSKICDKKVLTKYFLKQNIYEFVTKFHTKKFQKTFFRNILESKFVKKAWLEKFILKNMKYTSIVL